jgi:hypothetical protein
LEWFHHTLDNAAVELPVPKRPPHRNGGIDDPRGADALLTCRATMEQGTPSPAAVQRAQANQGMQQASSTTSDTPASGATATIARAHRRHRAAAASVSYAQGYLTTFFEDPPGIDVTKDNVGIGFHYNGSCVTDGWQAVHLYWYSPSGWGRNDSNWATSNTCTLEASSSYALFENDIFCFPNSCFNHYNRTSIHGHRDGGLFGFWNSWCDGDARCGLLSFHAQLVRQA